MRRLVSYFDIVSVVGARCGFRSEPISLLQISVFALIVSISPIVSFSSVDVWYPAGPPGGDVRVVVVDLTDSTKAYAGVWDAGVYRSSDGGATWSLANSEFRSVRFLAVAPSEPSTMYATADGVSVMVSRDAGQSWSDLNAPRTISGGGIAVHPTDPDTVFVTDMRLLATVDGGATWEVRGDWENIGSLVFNPNEPYELYGTGMRTGDTSSCLYRSTDAGFTWEDLGLCDTYCIAVDPVDPQHLLVGGYSIWLSIDGGAFFEEVYSWENYSGFVNELVFDPSGPMNAWAVTNQGALKSTDGGETWTLAIDGLDSLDLRSMAISAGAPSRVLAATAAGVSIRDSGDPEWRPANHGLPGLPVKSATAVTGEQPTWLAASDDNVLRSEDDGLTWLPSNVGLPAETMSLYPHPSLAGVVFADTSNRLYRSTDEGQTWYERGSGVPGLSFWDLSAHPIHTEVMYAVAWQGSQYWGKVVRSFDGGETWELLNKPRPAECCLSVAVDPVDPNVVLAGGIASLFRSTDGGNNWRITNIDTGNAVDIASIAFDPLVSGRVYASGAHFWVSEDQGQTWDVRSYEGSSSILRPDPVVADTLYGGKRSFVGGIRRSLDAGQHFHLWSDGMPTFPDPGGRDELPLINTLSVTPGGSGLLAATDAGLFHLRLAEIATVNPRQGPTTGGTWVEIVGGRFGPGTTVRFGDSESETVSVVSESRLVAVAPPHAEATVDVTVVTPEGRQVVARSAFRYTDIQSLAVALTPEIQTVGVGDTVVWTVTIGEPQAADLVVTLTAAVQGVLDLPAEVVIADGETEATVQAAALTEGSAVRITATLPDALSGSSAMALVNVLAAGQDYTPGMVVPGVARISGAQGSRFRTTLWLTNPDSVDTTVRLRFVPALGQPSGGGAETAEIAVFSLQSQVLDDVLGQAFGITAETFGSIVIEILDGTPMPVASARTYNDSDQGTFGQYIEAIDIPDDLEPWVEEQLVIGLSGNADFRSNLGIVNLGDSDLHATLTLEGPDGTELGETISLVLSPFTLQQINKVNNQAGAGAKRLFNVRVRGDGPFFSYGSMLDNVTSDPVYVPAAQVDGSQRGLLASGQKADLDGVAASPGANGTFFRSSLVVTNTSGNTAAVAAHFCKWGDRAEYDEPVSFELEPNETVRFADVVTDLFDLTGVAGTVHLDSWPQSVVAWARTYNDGGAEGTYGQFVAPILQLGGYLDGPAILHGISEDYAFRTNMGVWARTDTTVDVSIFTAEGDLVGHKVYQLEAQTQLFVPRVARDLGASPISGGFLRLIPGNQGAVAVWTSSVDNLSSDQTFMRAMAAP